MTKFSSNLEIIIDVDFKEPDKAESIFIDSDWKDTFFRFFDLEDIADHLSLNFHKAEIFLIDGKRLKMVDGFGSFIYDHNKDEWSLGVGGNIECGEVIIKYSQNLHVSYVEELDND